MAQNVIKDALTIDGILDKFSLKYLAPVLMFMLLRGIPIGCHILFLSFAAPKQNHWCALPHDLANLGWTSEQWIQKGIPVDKKGPSKCMRYAYNITNTSLVSFTNNTIHCDHWEYDTSFYDWTLVQEYNLVCDSSWYISLSQSILMFSMLVGNLFFSYLADRFGRKLALLSGLILLTLSSTVLIFAKSLVIFNIIRVVIGFAGGCFQGVVLALGTETLSQSKRRYVIFFYIGWMFGLLSMPWIAYGFRNWIYMEVTLAAMPLIVLANLLFVDESPRWLVANGKQKNAEYVINGALRRSGVDTNTVPVRATLDAYREAQHTNTDKAYRPSYLDFLKTAEIRRRAAVILLIFFTGRMLSFHLILFSARIGNNPFVSYTLVILLTEPGEILATYLLKKLPRKKVLLGSFIATAIAILCTLPLTEDSVVVRIVLVIIAKNFISLGNFTSTVYAAEVFPTVLRAMGIDGGFMASRVGAMFSPFFKELAEWSGEKAAVGVSALVALIGAIAVLAAPETYKQPLPDSIEDLDRNKKIATESRINLANSTVTLS